jgi:type II restriction enzyme
VKTAVEIYGRITNRDDVGIISEKHIDEIKRLLLKLPDIQKIPYPKFGLPMQTQEGTDPNIRVISESLTGDWRKAVFLSLGDFEDVFTSAEINIMAENLKSKFPNNNNREAKIRQILQDLRDLGLVEFVSRGVYKKLWI